MQTTDKIYVAGHRGLVGSAIFRALQARGYSNIVTRTRQELDLMDTKAVAQFFETEKPKLVFLAAAHVGGIAANNKYRAEFLYNNLTIQNNVIHQSYVSGVEKLLFLGSTCIYPREAQQPIKETYLLTDVLEYTNEPYAIAKIAGIKMCESYNLQYGTNFISAMPTNLYGSHDNFDLEKAHVLPALMRKIHLGKALQADDWKAIRNDLNKLPISGVDGGADQSKIEETLNNLGVSVKDGIATVEVWGSGKPMREFLWVDDMADACLFLMEKVNFSDCKAEKGEIRNTHINIGTGHDISIADLSKLIAERLDYTGKFVFDSSKPDGTMRKLTDVSKINSLGWTAKVQLSDGIDEMYRWYQNE